MSLPTTAGLSPARSVPRLAPERPPAGKKRLAPALVGSADALALAQYASAATERGELTAVVCAEALAAQRLAAEIAWFAPALRLATLPDWETLPYDQFSPHQDLVSERLATLYHAARGECDLLLVAASTALYRLAPPSYLAAYTFFLSQGETLDVDALRSQLALGGYQHVTQVVSPGEFSVRGGLIDLYPMGSALPYRIDLLDREIESIKSFDVDTQRTLYPVPSVRLLPAREFPQDEAARTRFRGRYREAFEGDPSKSPLYRDISNGITPGGIEYYLPLFFDATATLADYLPASATVCFHGDVAAGVERFWNDTEARYRLLRGDPGHPLLQPHDLFLPVDEFNGMVKAFARIDLPAPVHPAQAGAKVSGEVSAQRSLDSVLRRNDAMTETLPELKVERRAGDPLHALKRFATSARERVLIVADGLGRRETMQQYFAEYGFKPAIVADWDEFVAGDASPALTVGPVHAGFVWSAAGIAVVTEAELYADVARTSAKREVRRSNVEAMLRDLSEVRIGDPVVHEEHGIGRYLGLVTLDLGDGPNEFLHLQYANDAKLYVPVANLHLIGRYSGAAPEAAPLHELGSGQWDRAKRKAAQRAHDTAAELLNLYAQRAAREGHAFRFEVHDYEAFAAGFPFEETADQAAAIEAVIKDLVTGRPMDRLVCGDVGFGKTEVALRAAFIALADGKQVAVLVPTTLLADQHFQTFADRFAELPVKLVELSRFRTGKEAKTVLAGLADGTIDLVIGTHRLLQSDVSFKRLGLIIIDEEHRFGVRHKEQLKRLRAEVDVLTLTATPIPRTLAMSLEGLRDFSVIATAPERRLAIKTFVSPYAPGIVREAVLRELKRGGQVYYLHNDIATIQTRADKLRALVPEARLGIAHGQMPERELEQVMRDFYHQRCNLLLCSTIIESGLDVPTANTIIIDRADRFGLAQLHQLRGRVGRSHHQAYAYLLTPPEEALTAVAKKRLEAIQLMEELGSGFYLAMHDLEIRGAGEVLGEAQSGEMQQIGFQLYVDMLKAAVDALKAGRGPDLTEPLGVTTEISLHVPALLPETYCSDVHERLVLYKRLANCETEAELTAMQEELIDRFGLPPEPAQALLACHRLRIGAQHLGVAKIDAGADRSQIQFRPKPPFDPGKLIALVRNDRRYRLAGPDKVRIERSAPTLEERVAAVREFLATLA
ncbi:MAG TPA: transcription-repair coupling factor [Casimicrobiaceae bacterium]|nr:transcription-repair coupling factor [Casimicrobiaceae bacterium]